MSIFGVGVERGAIRIFRHPVSKFEALDTLARSLAERLEVADCEEFRQAVFDREAVMSTGIGGGVAIPHVRISSLDRPAIGLGLCEAGIEYETLDSGPVRIIVMFAMPTSGHKLYLGLLAQVMMALRVPGFCERLATCLCEDEVLAVLNEAEYGSVPAVCRESA